MLIFKVQNDIDKDHRGVKDVEKYHGIEAVKYFVDGAKEITCKHNYEEEEAFPLVGP